MIGEMISAVGSLIGTNMANQANADRAAEANRFSAEQYANRYQTTVKDLQAAGLSPMLAYSQGAGSSPSGAQAAPAQNAVGNAVEAYQRSKSVSSAAELQREQSEVAKSQVTLNSATAAKQVADAKVADEQAELLRLDQQKRKEDIPATQNLAKAYEGQATASAASAAQSYKQIEALTQNITNLKAELQRIQQNNDQNAPESEMAKKYPTFYYIFHKLMPSISGSAGNVSRFIPR